MYIHGGGGTLILKKQILSGVNGTGMGRKSVDG